MVECEEVSLDAAVKIRSRMHNCSSRHWTPRTCSRCSTLVLDTANGEWTLASISWTLLRLACIGFKILMYHLCLHHYWKSDVHQCKNRRCLLAWPPCHLLAALRASMDIDWLTSGLWYQSWPSGPSGPGSGILKLARLRSPSHGWDWCWPDQWHGISGYPPSPGLHPGTCPEPATRILMKKSKLNRDGGEVSK